MSKPNKLQKPVVPTQKQTTTTATRPTASTAHQRTIQNDTLVFGRTNYLWMLIGIGVMAVGYVLMSGGGMSSPDIWDESIIYSPMRIAVAPLLILVGLCIEVYALFKKNAVAE